MSDSDTVADRVIARIARDGVDTVFSVTGGGVMYLVDAIARSADVTLVSTQHEEYAGVAADGYARAGRPYGVAIGTTGPGAAQLFTAVAAAYQDSSPVLFLIGQVKSADSTALRGLKLRQNGTFEFDSRATFGPVTKYHSVLASADEIESTLEDALAAATSGRPGPVVIELPIDVQGALATGPLASQKPTESGDLSAEVTLAGTLAEALRAAERPLVVLGIGAVRSAVHLPLTESLDRAGIPYVTTQFGREAGRWEHELFLGSPGIKANRSANLAVCEADLLVVIGSSLHQQVIGWEADAFAKLPSRKVWFEIDPDVRDARRNLVDECHAVDAATAARALIMAADGTEGTAWAAWQGRSRVLRATCFRHYPAHSASTDRMCLYRAIDVLDARRDRFGTVTTDAGLVWYVLAQHYTCAHGSAYVSSGSFGAMGMALPYAIGAAAATRGRVLAITGDGSVMMSLSELATLKANGLPVLLVVNNNDGYVSIRSTHDRYFDGRKIGTDGSNGVFIPRVEAVAATFGIPYRAARNADELAAAVDELTTEENTGPALVEVFTYVDQAVEPLVQSRRLPDGSFASTTLADMSPPLMEN